MHINVICLSFCKISSYFIKRRNQFLGRRTCYICGKSFFKYLPVYYDLWFQKQIQDYGINFNFSDMTYNKKEYRCPFCGAIDRTRFIMTYIHKKYRSKKNVTLLYFAPECSGTEYLRKKMKNIKVDTNDLYAGMVDYQLDIQNLEGIKDAAYDVVICSHVLEHVEDDKVALKELYRVLKKGGEALILVPLDLRRILFDEKTGLSEYENWKRFGQKDHVRRYTENIIIKRIEDAGFSCRKFTRNDIDSILVNENAFIHNLRIYIAKKE